MKHIEVVAAIIEHNGKFLATQRGYGEFKDGWEFPGGKMEPGETQQDALRREIQEKLAMDINVQDFVCTVEYDYDNFHLIMHCYLCTMANQHIELKEHEAAKWLTKDALDTVDWLPADIAVVDQLKKFLA